ncbi:hypothetical protein [Neorhodopirellula lusitana]|uniref:hypothetical protein n=1 Tax=Neorhodopirellula lusitana TaxID=445327 RepID=UPI00384E599C
MKAATSQEQSFHPGADRWFAVAPFACHLLFGNDAGWDHVGYSACTARKLVGPVRSSHFLGGIGILPVSMCLPDAKPIPLEQTMVYIDPDE